MKLLERIDQEIQQYINRYNEQPGRIYLGRNEIKELAEFNDKTNAEAYKATLKGLQWFYVAEENHLWVC